MSEQSIEDVLAVGEWVNDGAMGEKWKRFTEAEIIDALASADLPLVDRERGIAVIRQDPELAEELYRWCMEMEQAGASYRVTEPCRLPDCPACTAARIIGGES